MEDNNLTLHMMNIISLTKHKLLLHKATESLSGISSDIYIYTESKFEPDHKSVQHKTISHSCQEPGQGGMTFIINNNVDVAGTDNNISDTVFLTLQRGKATTIIVGTIIETNLDHKD